MRANVIRHRAQREGCVPLQITASSYTGGLAAALTQPNTIYHGPLTRAELSRATVCVPWFSQFEIDNFKANPSGVIQDGQFWGAQVPVLSCARSQCLSVAGVGRKAAPRIHQARLRWALRRPERAVERLSVGGR